MSTNDILVEQKGSIMRIEMNRPSKKNALTFGMYDTLTASFKQADEDPTINVIYITGAGNAYSAGNDLEDFMARGDDPHKAGAAGRFIKQISITETPIVAAVPGVAVGVGATMLLHFDLVYASEQAMINYAFIDLGVVPEASSSYLLAQTVGPRRAAELFMLNERIGGKAAADMGLVNQVLPPAELQDYAWSKAEVLAKKPAGAMKDTKMLMRLAHEKIIAEQMLIEGKIFNDRVLGEEARAIFAAFLGKK